MKLFVSILFYVAISQTVGGAPDVRPTTQPAPVPAAWREMQDEILALRQEVAKLRAENTELRSLLKPGAKAVPEKMASAIKDGRLAIGMTLEQAEQSMQNNDRYDGKQLKSESPGSQVYEFLFTVGSPSDGRFHPDRSVMAVFSEGKIVELR
jgi:hypothetical protein